MVYQNVFISSNATVNREFMINLDIILINSQQCLNNLLQSAILGLPAELSGPEVLVHHPLAVPVRPLLPLRVRKPVKKVSS